MLRKISYFVNVAKRGWGGGVGGVRERERERERERGDRDQKEESYILSPESVFDHSISDYEVMAANG